MIKHIVFFKLKPECSSDDKFDLIKELKELKKKISMVNKLEAYFDIGKKSNSYDIVLNSEFDNMEKLEEYAIHQEHLKVVNKIKKLCLSTVKVDYEF